MKSTEESRKTKVEPAYLVEKTGEADWVIRKVDLSAPDEVLAEHRIQRGKCDCEGYGRSEDLRCRHTDMVLTNPTVTDYKTARKAAAEIISMWEPRFDRIVFDEYIEAGAGEGDPFADPGEGNIRAVRLKARGGPVKCKGKEYRKLFCVRRRMQVIVDIA